MTGERRFEASKEENVYFIKLRSNILRNSVAFADPAAKAALQTCDVSIAIGQQDSHGHV